MPQEFEESILFMDPHPVKPCQLQEKEKEPMTKGSSGTITHELSMKSDQDFYWLRTYLAYELSALTKLSLKWNNVGTPSGRSWWVLGLSGHLTNEIESGLSEEEMIWRTPTAEQMGTGQHMEGYQTKDGESPQIGHRVYNQNGKLAAIDLNRQIALIGPKGNWTTPNTNDYWDVTGEMRPCREATGRKTDYLCCQVQTQWVTPTCNTVSGGANHNSPSVQAGEHGINLHGQVAQVENQWPTARAVDGIVRHSQRWMQKRVDENRDIDLTTKVMTGLQNQENPNTNGNVQELKQHPKLSPDWVAQLMGFPHDWCYLPEETLSKLMATQSSPKSLNTSDE
jgi:hypothetical protein